MRSGAPATHDVSVPIAPLIAPGHMTLFTFRNPLSNVVSILPSRIELEQEIV